VIRLQKALTDKDQETMRQLKSKDTRINTLLVQLSGLSENVIRLQKTIRDKEEQEKGVRETGTFEGDKNDF
jgi:ATP phosphoribosyltransferase regulatory subunit HisZ